MQQHQQQLACDRHPQAGWCLMANNEEEVGAGHSLSLSLYHDAYFHEVRLGYDTAAVQQQQQYRVCKMT